MGYITFEHGKPILKRFTVDDFKRWLLRPPGACVVCGEPTKTQLVNQITGEIEHVHDNYENTPGCKYVWRYWQERHYKVDEAEWRRKNAEDIYNGYIDPRDYEDSFLDERDYYHDYRSYIASREWEIKSRHTKINRGWRCERCGFGASIHNEGDLHTHHKHYRTLYKERDRDLEVLCGPCHKQEHGK